MQISRVAYDVNSHVMLNKPMIPEAKQIYYKLQTSEILTIKKSETSGLLVLKPQFHKKRKTKQLHTLDL